MNEFIGTEYEWKRAFDLYVSRKQAEEDFLRRLSKAYGGKILFVDDASPL